MSAHTDEFSATDAATPAVQSKKRDASGKLHSREGSLTDSQLCFLVDNDSETVKLLDFGQSSRDPQLLQAEQSVPNPPRTEASDDFESHWI